MEKQDAGKGGGTTTERDTYVAQKITETRIPEQGG